MSEEVARRVVRLTSRKPLIELDFRDRREMILEARKAKSFGDLSRRYRQLVEQAESQAPTPGPMRFSTIPTQKEQA